MKQNRKGSEMLPFLLPDAAVEMGGCDYDIYIATED